MKYLRKSNFKFLEYLDHANLTEFLSMAEDIYPELVQVFYWNLRLVDGVLTSEVCHKPIRFTVEAFGRIIGVPSGDTAVSADGPAEPLANEFARLDATNALLRNPNEAIDKEIIAGQMKV